jgi:RimJ/RimL family protein N-acetyltransferase
MWKLGDEAAPMTSTSTSILSMDTPRLRLRQVAQTDFDDYAALCADAEVMRYLGDRVPLSRDDAWRQLAMLAGHWTLRGYGMWAVEELSSGKFVGRVGLHFPEGWPDPEIAWALSRAYWGHGYAREAASAAMRVAFETLEWPRAISLIAPLNQRSINLAERLGERFERTIPLRGNPVGLYAIDREQWRRANN